MEFNYLFYQQENDDITESEPDAPGPDIFLHNATAAADETVYSRGSNNETNSGDDNDGTDDLLCDMFREISPSPPRVSHIPTPRASGRRYAYLLRKHAIPFDNDTPSGRVMLFQPKGRGRKCVLNKALAIIGDCV